MSSSEDRILNVIFHGMWVFVPRHFGIEVMAPRVPGHAYLAGAWKEEHPLHAEEFYYLEGIRPNDSRAEVLISANNNIILPHAFVKGYERDVFCTWLLPRPLEFRSIRNLPIGSYWFKGPHANLHYVENLRELALVQVLRYSLDGKASPSIGSLSGQKREVPWKPKPRGGAINLHLFAEERKDFGSPWMNRVHPTLAFRDFTRLIDLDLEFGYPANWAASETSPHSNLGGVQDSEILSLTERGSLPGTDPASHGPYNCVTLVDLDIRRNLLPPFIDPIPSEWLMSMGFNLAR